MNVTNLRNTKRNTVSLYLLTLLLLLLSGMNSVLKAQTVMTDKSDYLPGQFVIITGEGWLPGETVNFLIQHEAFNWHPDETFSTTALEGGFIYDGSYVIDPWDLGEAFLLTATGATSGAVATTTFTDGDFLGSIEIGSQVGYFIPGTPGTATFPITVTRNPDAGNGKFDVRVCITANFPSFISYTFNATGFQPGQGIIEFGAQINEASGTMTVNYDGTIPPDLNASWSFSIMGYVLPNNQNGNFDCDHPTNDNATGTWNGVLSFGYPPSIVCPQARIVNTEAGKCEAAVFYDLTYVDSFSAVLAAGQFKGYPEPTLFYSLDGTNYLPGTGSGISYPKGVNTVYLKASNGISPDAVCSFNITVEDNEAPALTGTPYGGTTGTNACMADAATAAPWNAVNALQGYTDNCLGIVTAVLTNTQTSGTDCDWTVTYTFSVKDVDNNTLAGQSYSNTGGDKTPPSIGTNTFPDGQTGLDLCFNAIPAGPSIADIAALYTDNCGGAITVEKSGTPTGGDCSWSVTYTYTVRDKCNNYVLNVPGVTYSGGDKTPPSIGTNTFPVGQADLDLCFNAIPAGPSIADIAALYTDNCGGAITVEKSGTPTGGDCSWSVTYTYTVRDKCNNYVLNVPGGTYSGGDKTPPSIGTNTFPVGQTDLDLCFNAIPAGPSIADIAALYTDNCGGAITVEKSGTPTGGDCSWSVTYTYTVRDKCNNYVLNVPGVTYSGGDKTPPSIGTNTFPVGQSDLDLCFNAIPAGPSIADIAALYTDNCGGDITVVKSGTPAGNDCSWSVTYTYTVRDKCNNFVLNVPGVTYSGGDKTPPSIGTNTFPVGQTGLDLCFSAIPVGPSDADIAALYTDNCGGDITVVKSGTPTGNDCLWSVTYNYTVRDKCNNYVLNVPGVTYSGGDKTPPTVLTKDIDVNITGDGTVTITPSQVNNGSNDNCSGTNVTLSLDITEFTCDDIGKNTVVLTVTDPCGNSATGTATVTVYVPTTTVALLSAQSARYMDDITLYAEVESNCHTQGFAGTVEFKLNGISVGSAPAYPIPSGEDGYPTKLRATLVYKILVMPGDYDVTAAFTPSTAYYKDSTSVATPLIVVARDASPSASTGNFYTGPIYAWTTTPTSSTGTVTLSATIIDKNETAGDVRGATVTFYYINTDGSRTPVPSAQNLPVNLVNLLDGTVGTVSADVQLNLGNQLSQDYTVGIEVGGGYTNDITDPESQAMITIYKYTAGGRINGSAYLTNTINTNGWIRGSIDNQTMVSYDVKYNKKGTNPQGRVSIRLYSYYDANGILDNTLHTYIITSNAINYLLVNKPTTAEFYFSSKANLKEEVIIDGVTTNVSVEGNSVLQMWGTDFGNNGGPDGLLGIQYDRKAGGIWYSSFWNGTTTVQKPIDTAPVGFVKVSATSSSEATSNNAPATGNDSKLQLEVYPNPSSGPVNFRFSIPENAKVTLEVYSATGRLVDRVFQGDVEAAAEKVAVLSKPLPEGVYSYRLIYGNKVKSGKFIRTLSER